MSCISEKQKKLRAWLRRRGWHTGSSPANNICAWCEAPAQKGITHVTTYSKDVSRPSQKNEFEWHYEYTPVFSVRPDGTVNLNVNIRKVYTAGPDFEEKSCYIKPEPYLSFPLDELQHVIDLMQESKEDCDQTMRKCKERKNL